MGELVGAQQDLPAAVREVLRTTGKPLDPSIREEMGNRFGHDFGDVRVHTGDAAEESADAISALAYTLGNQVVFGKGQYTTATVAGRQRLAHELAHVLQQSRGGSPPYGVHSVGLEASARAAASAAVANEYPVQVRGASAPGLARETKPEASDELRVEHSGNEIRIQGVPFFHIENQPESSNLRIDVNNFRAPNEINIRVIRDQGVNVRVIPGAIEQLMAKGFNINLFDVTNDKGLPVEDRPQIALGGPLPTMKSPARKRSAAPSRKSETVATRKVQQDVASKNDLQSQVVVPPTGVAPLEPPVTPTRELEAPPPKPEDLIDAHTSFLNLDEEALGADLLKQADKGNSDYVQSVLDALGSTDRDDVSVAFAEAATDEQLRALAGTERGRRLLDRLFDELTEGEVGADEHKQADRILAIKTRVLLSPEQFVERTERAKDTIVLPYRKPGFTVLTAAPIFASRLPNGKIWVRTSTTIFGTEYYHDPDIKLPKEVWRGIELEETDVVGIKLYDEGGQIVYVPALYLLQAANENTQVVFHKIGEAAFLGATLGAGTVVDTAGEGGVAVAEASTAARVGAAVRTGLVWADRAAFALDITNTVIQEHRGWIIETWGESGRSFVNRLDQVNGYVQIYGLVRGGVGLLRLTANLRKAYQEWRVAAKAMKLEGDDLQTVERISKETEKLLQELDEAAKQAPVTTPRQAGTSVTPSTIEGQPSLKVIQGGGQATPPKQGHLQVAPITVEGSPTPKSVSKTPQAIPEVGELEGELQTAEQQFIKRAVGDPAAEGGLQPRMQRQGPDVRATTGGKRPSSTIGKSTTTRRTPSRSTSGSQSAPTDVERGRRLPSDQEQTRAFSSEAKSPTAGAVKPPVLAGRPEFTPTQKARFERVLDFLNDRGIDPKRLFNSPEEAEAFFKSYPTTNDALNALEGRARGFVGLRLEEVEAGQAVSAESKTTGLDPFTAPPTAAEIRLTEPGIASGGRDLPPIVGRLFSPTRGRVSTVPGQIAARMRGMKFNNWRDFRETFWKFVSQDAAISREFSAVNRTRMESGLSPFVEAGEAVGGRANAVLQLNHIEPIEQGGSLYDFDNIEVVTPRAHQTLGTYE